MSESALDMSPRRRLTLVAMAGLGVVLTMLGAALGHLDTRWMVLAMTAAAFFVLPVEIGWWAWIASTFTQGVVPGQLGWSLNILGLLAFWSGMAGALAKNPGFFRQYRLPSGAFFFLLLAGYVYFVVAALQGWARDSAVALQSLKFLTVFFVTSTVGVGLFAGDPGKGASGRRRFAWGVVALTTSMALLGILEFILKKDLLVQGVDTALYLFRVNGVSPNPIVFGFLMAWAIPFAFFLVCGERAPATGFSWPRLLAVFALGALFLACFLTSNRQTFVLMTALAIGAALLMRGGWMRWVVAGGVFVVLATSPIVFPKVVERFALLGDVHYDTSFKVRRDNFRIAREMVRAHPATGIGLGQYPMSWSEYRPDELYYLHYDTPERHYYNDFGYMQVATETGLIGVAIFLLWISSATLALFVQYGRARGRATPLDETGGNSGLDYEQANWFAAILLLVAFTFMTSFIQDTFLRPRLWIVWALVVYWTSQPISIASRKDAQQTDNEG